MGEGERMLGVAALTVKSAQADPKSITNRSLRASRPGGIHSPSECLQVFRPSRLAVLGSGWVGFTGWDATHCISGWQTRDCCLLRLLSGSSPYPSPAGLLCSKAIRVRDSEAPDARIPSREGGEGEQRRN